MQQVLEQIAAENSRQCSPQRRASQGALWIAVDCLARLQCVTLAVIALITAVPTSKARQTCACITQVVVPYVAGDQMAWLLGHAATLTGPCVQRC
jgi:hypothetical protein